MTAIALLLILLADAIILGRCLWVLHRMHPAAHGRGYAHFAAFGGSYVLLAIGAAAQGLQMLAGVAPDLSDWCFCLSSAGLIVFDRRGRPRIDHHAGGMTVETLHHPRES